MHQDVCRPHHMICYADNPCVVAICCSGAFLFDILLPPEYPDKPPSVQFLTTGNGTVRFK